MVKEKLFVIPLDDVGDLSEPKSRRRRLCPPGQEVFSICTPLIPHL
jgi:hypothetical protein